MTESPPTQLEELTRALVRALAPSEHPLHVQAMALCTLLIIMSRAFDGPYTMDEDHQTRCMDRGREALLRAVEVGETLPETLAFAAGYFGTMGHCLLRAATAGATDQLHDVETVKTKEATR